MDLPQSNSVIIRTNGRHEPLVAVGGCDVAHDIIVQLVLILFSIRRHVIRVDEVTSHLIDSEGLGDRSGQEVTCEDIGSGKESVQLVADCAAKQ